MSYRPQSYAGPTVRVLTVVYVWVTALLFVGLWGYHAHNDPAQPELTWQQAARWSIVWPVTILCAPEFDSTVCRGVVTFVYGGSP